MKKEYIPLLVLAAGGFLLYDKSSAASTDASGRPFTPPFASPTDFIKMYYPLAVSNSANNTIPALVTIAQAGIESGWGTSDLFMYHNNVFGIKAGKGWPGKSHQGFRSYDSAADSFQDHAALLSKDSRYARAFDPLNVSDAYSFARIIAPVYTPDKGYYDLISATMRKIAPFVS